MGYKSVLRSMGAAANKASRENERNARKIQKEEERVNKKIAGVEAKMEKIEDALSDQLAKGKVDHGKFSKLLKRKDDIGIDLIIFGKTPAISAAKRYICGKIEKKEFEEICSSIISPEIREEKSKIKDEYNGLLSKIENFKKSCNSNNKDICQKCGKQKSLFNPIKSVEDLKLCGKCKKELKQLTNYISYSGDYFFVNSHKISINEIEKPNLSVNIFQEYL